MEESYLERCISCPICFEIFCGAIFQCKNHHLVCEGCCQNLATCPQFRCTMTSKSRNRAVENLVSVLKEASASSSENIAASAPPLDDQEDLLLNEPDGNLVFNAKCKGCNISHIKNVRFVCLLCINESYCSSCYLKIQRGGTFASGKLLSPREHVFAVIENTLQNDAFSAIMKNRDQSLFTKNGREELALSCTCAQCSATVSQGFVCLHCIKFRILCGNCKKSDEFHKAKPHHLFVIANKTDDLVTSRAHFYSARLNVYFIIQFILQFLFTFPVFQDTCWYTEIFIKFLFIVFLVIVAGVIFVMGVKLLVSLALLVVFAACLYLNDNVKLQTYQNINRRKW